jgi:hypothetical protein
MPYDISYLRLLHAYPPHRKFWLETIQRPATNIIPVKGGTADGKIADRRANASKRRDGTPPDRTPRIVIATAAESRISSLAP